MPETDRITIDPERCTGDGICVAVCPATVFDQAEAGAKASVARPEGCIRCGHCVAACPTEAVRVHGVRVAPFPADRRQPPVCPGDLLALLAQRRSVRRMTSEPVPKEALKQIIEAASTAPTAKNARAIRVSVIQDPALRKALVDRCRVVYGRLARRLSNPLVRLLVRLFRPSLRPMLPQLAAGFRWLTARLEAGEDPILFDAPATVVLSAPEVMGMSAYDCSFSLMNGILMAEALGLGTCIMGFFLEAARRDAEIRRMLQLPDHERVFGVFTVGRPKYPMRRQIDRRHFRTAWL